MTTEGQGVDPVVGYQIEGNGYHLCTPLIRADHDCHPGHLL
ncbi:hypothetical protein [Novosphingobium sp. KN65.2]|jgi:hypothetical protein|nr:hypothetical protein [Novosphingobium sp. KN65.2]CDO38973.1 hypothetical protein SPHV1_910013 [Novosphingobium sp. KN65.2]